MQIIREIEGLAGEVFALGGETVALVPTMGALHAGHMALVTEAKRRADRVVATIFVNPLQFGANEDLDRYPRQEAADAEMLEQAGCDLLWIPSVGDIYPDGFATQVSVRGLSERWEGEASPGHFDGVATVVARLLLAVIRRMVTDLGLGVEIVGVPTVRDDDGLALSSRNAYLWEDDRKRAVALPNALMATRDAILSGEPVDAALAAAKDAIRSAGFSSLDYVALVDASSLEPLDEPRGAMRLIAAATIGGTRLIDNIAVETGQSPDP